MRQAGAAAICLFMVCSALTLEAAAQQGNYDKELQKGTADLQHHKYRDAEKHFRAAVQAQPDSWQAHAGLADSLFAETSMECIPEYEKAKELADADKSVAPPQKRPIIDQLGVIYGMSGKFDESIETYQQAIAQDPDYPPYYYNLACSYSESGDLDKAIFNLQEAYRRKDKWPAPQSFPDPRKDDSFKNYLGNEQFKKALKDMGFN
jgi:tetratricopeptide (TPR) repeat protein